MNIVDYTRVEMIHIFYGPMFHTLLEDSDHDDLEPGLNGMFELIAVVSQMCLTGKHYGRRQLDTAALTPRLSRMHQYLLAGNGQSDALVRTIRRSPRVVVDMSIEPPDSILVSFTFYVDVQDNEEAGKLVAHCSLLDGTCTPVRMY